ncbi:hypothetical protein HPB50_008041 [Hyalomma asiaticum]|uniref:Uncharacterized protein n=1 Tax=Hyalomma asiaticum TaxID=266040 RepID=A0ACB7TCW0_HYAAI|nr:hypothetical protein HPB50_008041 [Hyalomma asiaticum]
MLLLRDEAVAHIKRPQSLDIIAHLSSVPAQQPSPSDDKDSSYSSSSNQVNVPESDWLQETDDAGSKARYEIDKERASSAEKLAYSLKQEVKTLQARCKQLEMQQHQDLLQMTSDLSCKLRAAADSAEGTLRLAPVDPYKIASSDRLVELLQGNLPPVNSGFSADKEELSYSLPHEDLFLSVPNCIEHLGTVAFQNASGISMGGFLKLLHVYLTSTTVSFKDHLYLQK